MTRLSLADTLPSLLAPVRFTAFADRPVRLGRRQPAVTGVAWQGWNPDAVMEGRIARLPGAGSFYWPCAWRGYLAARALMRADASVRQVTIETIGGREVARLYR